MESPTLFVPKLVFKTLQGRSFFYIDQIVRIESSHNSCLVYALNKAQPVRILHTFKTLLKHLAKYPCFFQCHRCHIINTNHIVHFHEKQFTLVMEIGEVPISITFRDTFLKEVLEHYDSEWE